MDLWDGLGWRGSKAYPGLCPAMDKAQEKVHGGNNSLL